MLLDPHHKADLSALMTAIALSNSEGSILAVLVDEDICAGEDEARAMFERLRDAAEAR